MSTAKPAQPTLRTNPLLDGDELVLDELRAMLEKDLADVQAIALRWRGVFAVVQEAALGKEPKRLKYPTLDDAKAVAAGARNLAALGATWVGAARQVLELLPGFDEDDEEE